MSRPVRLPMVLVALKNLLSLPATRRYPEETRAPFPGFRGHLALDMDSCVLCGICDRRCPCGALAVARDEKTLTIEHLRCTACGVCVDACNKHSLRLLPETLPVRLASARGQREVLHKPPPAAAPPAGR